MPEWKTPVIEEFNRYPALTTIQSHGVPRLSKLPLFKLRVKPDAKLPARQKPYRVSVKENEYITREVARYVEGGMAIRCNPDNQPKT
eukprot:Nk52_evm1s2162 gene=Nk52_evmTU1s2162